MCDMAKSGWNDFCAAVTLPCRQRRLCRHVKCTALHSSIAQQPLIRCHRPFRETLLRPCPTHANLVENDAVFAIAPSQKCQWRRNCVSERMGKLPLRLPLSLRDIRLLLHRAPQCSWLRLRRGYADTNACASLEDLGRIISASSMVLRSS